MADSMADDVVWASDMADERELPPQLRHVVGDLPPVRATAEVAGVLLHSTMPGEGVDTYITLRYFDELGEVHILLTRLITGTEHSNLLAYLQHAVAAAQPGAEGASCVPPSSHHYAQLGSADDPWAIYNSMAADWAHAPRIDPGAASSSDQPRWDPWQPTPCDEAASRSAPYKHPPPKPPPPPPPPQLQQQHSSSSSRSRH